jgi:hypothetical protein
MYHYIIKLRNNGITRTIISIYHEKYFSSNEFNDISENAILHALLTEKKKNLGVYMFDIEADLICEYLILKGFTVLRTFVTNYKYTCQENMSKSDYYFNPGWTGDSIHNKKLLKIVKKWEKSL